MTQTTVHHRPLALADFDESGWPVNVLLLALAGCAAGAITVRGDFETIDLWENAWTQLAVLAGIVAVIALTATLLRGHIQRRMQLAILASLAAHLALSMSMRHYQLPVVEALIDRPSDFPEFQPTLIPDYQSVDKYEETPTELFERPVETETPDPERLRLEKPEIPEAEVEVPKRQEVKPEQPEPTPVELQRAEASPPKRAERLSDPARSQTPPIDQPVESLSLPQATAETRAHDELNPESTAQRTKTEVRETQPSAHDVPLDVAPADSSSLTRTQRREQVAPAELATPQMTRTEVTAPSESLAQPSVEIAPQQRPTVGPSRADLGRLSDSTPAADMRSIPRDATLGSESTGAGEPSAVETIAGDKNHSLAPILAGRGPQRSESVGQSPRGVPSAGATAPSTIVRQNGNGAESMSVEIPRLAGPAAATAPSQPSSGKSKAPGPASMEPGAGLAMVPRRGTSLPAHIAAPAGPSGLSEEPSVDAGMPNRLARAENELVHTATPPLILEKTVGDLKIDAHVRDTAVEGLKQRDLAGRAEVARRRGGTEKTERAVEMGLDFLARHQAADGSWSLHAWHAGRGYTEPASGSMESDTGATGLALLAFLGAGYTQSEGKYRDNVGRALTWLVSHQKADGDLFVSQGAKTNQSLWLYSHGVASTALCEAYGMTRDAALRGPAQRALEFISASQHPVEGGWQYSPRQGSDTSVSEWQMMALKAGELAGLSVPSQTYAKLMHWLDTTQEAGADPSRPHTGAQKQSVPSRAILAGSLLMRLHLGWKKDDSKVVAGANWLHGQLPFMGTRSDPKGERDTYYWYYGTQVMFQMPGRNWDDWNAALSALLVDSQVQEGGLAGSWDPLRPVPDRWSTEAGRLYVTVMHLLMLEVYYRHLPIQQSP